MEIVNERALSALVADLASPDPKVRDEAAYAELCRLVLDGVLDDRLGALVGEGCALLTHAEVQARSSGSLLVALTVARDAVAGALTHEQVATARAQVATWWEHEDEVTGWDDRRGWLHVLAHGADAVDKLGVSRWTGPEDVRALLRLVVRRVARPTTYRMVHDEEHRIAYAALRLLAHDDLTVADAAELVTGLARTWDVPEDDRPDAGEVHNAMAVVGALHLQLSLGVEDTEAPAGTRELLEAALGGIWPWSAAR